MTMKGCKACTLFILFSFLFLSCNPKTKITDSAEEPVMAFKNPVVKKDARIFRNEIRYFTDSLDSAFERDSLLNSYQEDQLNTILAINRVDKGRIRANTPLIIPECASAEFNDYSPFPENINFLQCIPKTVLISQRVQAFALYEKGSLIKWGPVSTGKGSTKTPNGLNYGNYKAKRKISTIDESWIMPYYFNFMNYEGIGTHEYSLPGYPASHGCVRMYREDAKFIYDWAEMWQVEKGRITHNGTPFMVFGKYDFTSNKPWFHLSEDMKANDLTQEEIDTLQEYLRRYQQDPRNFEGKLTEESKKLASS